MCVQGKAIGFAQILRKSISCILYCNLLIFLIICKRDYVTVLIFTISLASVYSVLQVLIAAEFLLFEKDNECVF